MELMTGLEPVTSAGAKGGAITAERAKTVAMIYTKKKPTLN